MRTRLAADAQALDVIAETLERHLLDAFWQTATRVSEARLALLLVYTAVIIRRAESWDPETVRAQHAERRGAAATTILDRTRCFACSATAQLYAHHVIEIQYGGSNAVRNQVPLCFDCHQYLHPWLTEDDRAPTDRRSTAFESIGSIMARSVKDIVP